MDDRTIYTKDGEPIYYFNGDVSDYLNKTTLLFGGSGSGKTTIIESIMYKLKNHVPNWLVIAPNTSNKAYIKKLPARCIKEDLSKKLILKIWKRQESFTQLYNIANDNDILSSLFYKCPDRKSYVMVKAILESAKNNIIRIKNSMEMNYAQKKEQIASIEELRNNKIKMLYKSSIRQMRDKLFKMNDLTDKEKIALKFLDINPALTLVIDDCSEKVAIWMKYFKGEFNPIESIFYRGRWNNITVLFAAHDDKLVDPKLRKNARVTFCCNSTALMAYLNKQQSGFTNIEKKNAQKLAKEIFGDDESEKTHKKICYIRENRNPWQYHIADLHSDFTLGCGPLRQLAEKLPKKDDNLAENIFLKDMIDSESKPKKKKQPRYSKSSNRKY